jgi:hypothetical protein
MIWTEPVAGNLIRVRWDLTDRSAEIINEIDTWCKQLCIGRRMSYDMWRFDSAEEITAFNLRWNNYAPRITGT